nr:HAD family hydrolase [uncultured Eisenbergiella sp.]
MIENISWVFFDIGSTIINEQSAYEHRFREIAEAAKIPYDNVYQMAVNYYKQNKKGDLEAARALEIDLAAWHNEDEVLYDNVPHYLEIVKKKYKIGIIANQPFGTAERLEKHGILQYFDLVIASAEEGVAKPDKRIFERALERSECKSENAIMIGDRIDNDIVPSKRLGFHTIWVKQGFGQYWNVSCEEEKPDYTVACLSDIISIL